MTTKLNIYHMNPIVAPVAKLLAVLTVIADVGIIFFVGSVLLALGIKSVRTKREALLKKVAPYARVLAFVVALTATSGSLFYSEVAKFTPCLLCWWQRIFMYPQVLLIGLGVVKKDKDIADYAMAMSLVGGSISLYHYYIQLGGNKFIPCATVGYSINCTQRFSLEFGYITIPMMALSAFVAIFLLMHLSKRFAQ